jgi:PIN domain nuclease of toxin-antitoxin system
MKHLWDTHALIWGMEHDPRLTPRAEALASESGNSVSCISLWEVGCLLDLGRIRLSIPCEEWLDVVAERVQVLPITPRIAAATYELGPFHGDPADRIIAATSLVLGLRIVTRDRALRDCAKLDCVWE